MLNAASQVDVAKSKSQVDVTKFKRLMLTSIASSSFTPPPPLGEHGRGKNAFAVYELNNPRMEELKAAHILHGTAYEQHYPSKTAMDFTINKKTRLANGRRDPPPSAPNLSSGSDYTNRFRWMSRKKLRAAKGELQSVRGQQGAKGTPGGFEGTLEGVTACREQFREFNASQRAMSAPGQSRPRDHLELLPERRSDYWASQYRQEFINSCGDQARPEPSTRRPQTQQLNDQDVIRYNSWRFRSQYNINFARPSGHLLQA